MNGTHTINDADHSFDVDRALDNVLQLARELETEAFVDVQPWMIARLIRVAVADDLAAGFSPPSAVTP